MVIAGLDPAIHEALQQNANVRCAVLHFIMDARVKPAHDQERRRVASSDAEYGFRVRR